MKLKYVSLLATIILSNIFQVFAQGNSRVVFLTGTIKNFNNQAQIENISDIEKLILPSSERIFVPDSAGKFSITFKLNESNYFRLGRNILYLSPGDSLSLYIDYNAPQKAVFKGKSSATNDYLKSTPFPKAGSFLEAGDNIQATITQTTEAIFAAEKAREKLLQLYQKKIPEEFKILEIARIKADVINSLFHIYTYYTDVYKLRNDSLAAFRGEYKKITKPYISQYSQDFLNPLFLKLEVYRQVLSIILEHTADSSKIPIEITDWLKANQLANQIRAINEREKIGVLKPEIQKIKTLRYRSALSTTCNALLKFGNGDVAVNFNGRDKDNKLLNLNSLRGKVIYVDIWATWCGPCLQEFPHFIKLKEKYKNNPDVVFVSLSIDSDLGAWKRNILARNSSGIEVIIDRAKLKEYAVVGIPRTIVIGKDFKIAAMHGPLPSSNDSDKLIDSLLKK